MWKRALQGRQRPPWPSICHTVKYVVLWREIFIYIYEEKHSPAWISQNADKCPSTRYDQGQGVTVAAVAEIQYLNLRSHLSFPLAIYTAKRDNWEQFKTITWWEHYRNRTLWFWGDNHEAWMYPTPEIHAELSADLISHSSTLRFCNVPLKMAVLTRWGFLHYPLSFPRTSCKTGTVIQNENTKACQQTYSPVFGLLT